MPDGSAFLGIAEQGSTQYFLYFAYVVNQPLITEILV